MTKAFYLAGWRGIDIEPNPYSNKLPKKQRLDDRNLAAAVGEKSGQVVINFIRDAGLSTSASDIAEMHIASGWQVQGIRVELKTLSRNLPWRDWLVQSLLALTVYRKPSPAAWLARKLEDTPVAAYQDKLAVSGSPSS